MSQVLFQGAGMAWGISHYMPGSGVGTRIALTEGTQKASGRWFRSAEFLGKQNHCRWVTGLAEIGRFLGGRVRTAGSW